MKFSEKWLREWVDPKIDSTMLSEQIIESGIEIESIDKIIPLFNGVVVGKIISCMIHPTLNNLKIVKVDIGKKKILNILCKAFNCRNRIKVAVATIGSTLPNNIKISLKKFHDQKSEGMLCSFFELGLFHSNNEIIEFPEETPIGINVNDYFLLEDNLIKVNVTPNRPDGLSIVGIARNIAVINNINTTPLKERNNPVTIDDKFPIYINMEKKDINFFGRVINNININAQTPFWMKKKLFMCEVLSENVIINIINYILIEIGQPLNILNADIIDTFIQIKKTNEQEVLNLKKDLKIILDKNILVFSDKSKILFIPGNINSYLLEIDQNTKNIFLTSYLVDHESIFNITKTIGTNNILNYYNHGIDFSLQKYAIEYATELIIQICGGNAGSITYYTDNSYFKNKKIIKLYFKNINKISGFFINYTVIFNILLRLEYQVEDKKDYWNVIPPTWRFDILIEEDVIGDILRIYGYKKIPLIPLKEINFNFYKIKDDFKKDYILNKLATLLIHRGYYEIITYPFIDPVLQNNILSENSKNLFISNPISKDLSCMRISLWPGLIKTLSYNKNREQDSIRLFERGLCFSADDQKNLGVNQQMLLGGVISGFNDKENWFTKRKKVDFYDLKGDLESVLNLVCGLNNWKIKNKKISGLHPNQSAKIFFNDVFIGSFGKINPFLEEKLDLSNNTFFFELLIDKILDLKNFQDFKVREYSKFPSSRRDISILISEKISYADIIKVCKNCFLNKQVDINLFDIYLSEKFSNKKSLGISFTFQDERKTLKENEINLMLDHCIRTLIEKFQIILRK